MFDSIGNVYGHAGVKETNKDTGVEKFTVKTKVDDEEKIGSSDTANATTRKRKSFNGIRNSPYHRRQSWVTQQQRAASLQVSKKVKFQFPKWHFLDNQGSFNGWFDWLPLWMRVGYWSPIFVSFLIGFWYSLVAFKPTPLEFPPALPSSVAASTRTGEEDFNPWFLIDCFVCCWGVFVVCHAQYTMGSISGFYISYTGWSWGIMTARAGLEAVAQLLPPRYNTLSKTLATIGSALRFPTAVAAVITFTIWNFILLPLIYFGSMEPGSDKRKSFLKFNFGFFMSNIHLANLPLSMMNTIWGPTARIFAESDLWMGLLVAAVYSALYLFVLDRLGLHFYPIFCPRTGLSSFSFGAVLYLYYYLWQQGNQAIMYLNPDLLDYTIAETTK